MEGKILECDTTKQKGVISGDDGNRYYFNPEQVKGGPTPASGKRVDFQVQGENAQEIYVENPATDVSSTKIIAALLGIFLGGLGAHKFYLGFKKQGAIMLIIFLFGFVLLGIPSSLIAFIGLIEGIIYLARSSEDFEKYHVSGHKGWF
jgi:TM2 domain-containing membrane protein YozV